MKILARAIKHAESLIFIDLEATGVTHEMIEIGAYRVSINKEGEPTKVYPPFKSYVTAKHPITHIVTKLTGITEETLKKEGRPFKEVMDDFKHYVGSAWRNALFVTFGSHDAYIISTSYHYNPEASQEDAHHLINRHFDFQSFLKRYVQDRNGNPYSLLNYLKVFELSFEGQEHDAVMDAYNLFRLYKAFLERTDIAAASYEMTLSHSPALPAPLKTAFAELSMGNDLTAERWKEAIAEVFK